MRGPDGGDARIILGLINQLVIVVALEFGYGLGVAMHDQVGAQAGKPAHHADHKRPQRGRGGRPLPEHTHGEQHGDGG